MTDVLTFWLSSFFTVFLLGFQSRSVNRGLYVASASCSLLIAVCQSSWVHLVAVHPWGTSILVTGTSGPAGICAAIFVHKRMHKPG